MFIRVNHSRPNYQITLGNDMTYSPAFRAYSANANLPDGRTLQPSVPGTIARGETPIYYQATPEDALRAGEELKNPYDPDSDAGKAAVERGAEVYRITCIPCHGAGGAGDGLVAKRGFPPPPSFLNPDSLKTKDGQKMKDGQLFHILTYGQGGMSSYAAQIPPPRRWDVIQYIRDLQREAAQAAADAAELPPAPEPLTDQPTEQSPTSPTKGMQASSTEQSQTLSKEEPSTDPQNTESGP